ncbi:MAG: hypothetical protein ABSB31_05480 [Dehalococcoidia bacterium]
MVVRRQCAALGPTGRPCRAAPLKDSRYCWVHSPERAKEAQEARRLGGLRRRRESAISSAFLFGSLTSVAGIRRILEIAVVDTLALDNDVARNRVLGSLAQAAMGLLEKGEMEERLTALEQTVQEQTQK